MTDDLDALQAETEVALAAAADLRAWDAVRVATLGRNGRLTALLRDLGKTPAEQRRERGAALNRLKDALTLLIEARRAELEHAELDARLAAERLDPTLPPRPREMGLIHPISRTMEEIAAIFGAMGCEIAEGPDVESDWMNFSALNIPPHHPARADQDTFYLPARGNAPPPVLRTQTSPVQIRTMLERTPPIYVVSPGKVFRTDDLDATHTPVFHQIEALAVDKGLTMAHLRGAIDHFVNVMFGEGTRTRVRASYFPFTEPSMETDFVCFVCHGDDPACRTCGGSGWIELGGSGMVNRKVLRACGIDPDVYTGFAFGLGIERALQLRHGVTDMHDIVDGDARFSEQFGMEV